MSNLILITLMSFGIIAGSKATTPPGTRGRGVPTEETFYDINKKRKGRPKNQPGTQKPTSHMLAHRGRNHGTAGSPTEPGTTNRNETVGRNPEATKPGHQEPHDPPTKARHPLDKGASFCPALRRRNHNTKTRNINRTRTELDKGPKSSPIVDLTKGQKSSETGTQKATPQSSQKRKKVLSPATRQRHHRNHKSQVRRDQGPGTRPTSRKPVGQKQKPPKEAETGQKRHF